MVGDVLYSKGAVLMGMKEDGYYYALACAEALEVQGVRPLVEVHDVNGDGWEQYIADRRKLMNVRLSGVMALSGTDGAWTTEEIMEVADAGNRVAMKLYYETPDGSVMETTFTGLLGEMGFDAQMAGGEKAKWSITITNTGQHNRVADTTQWLWSSNTDMLWSSGAIMDLLYG